MSARKWYWPRPLIEAGAWKVWLMPTMFALGCTYFPELRGSSGYISFGIGPLAITYDPTQTLDG